MLSERYDLMQERQSDIIVYDRISGRAYVYPFSTDNNGQKYVIIRNETYYF